MTNAKVLGAITKSQRIKLSFNAEVKDLKMVLAVELGRGDDIDRNKIFRMYLSLSNLYNKASLDIEHQHLVIRNYLRFVKDAQLRDDANEELNTPFAKPHLLMELIKESCVENPPAPPG